MNVKIASAGKLSLLPRSRTRPWVCVSTKTCKSFGCAAGHTVEEAILQGFLELVERLGLEMLVLDQTRPEIGLPVVKVIVPGLRHFWARFAPGRLYDSPVRLGWLERPLAEKDVNPIPMFL